MFKLLVKFSLKLGGGHFWPKFKISCNRHQNSPIFIIENCGKKIVNLLGKLKFSLDEATLLTSLKNISSLAI